MALRDVTAKTDDEEGKTLGPITCQYDFGTSTAEKTTKFGDDVVNSNAEANMVVSAQDVIRQGLKAGKNKAEIQKALDAWKPGIKKKGRSKAEKMQAEFDSMTAEDKKALLAKLTSGAVK